MSNEELFLKKWISIKEGNGLARAQVASKRLLLIGLLLSVAIAFLIYYEANSVLIAFLSLVAGWTIAERNALRSRIESWPQLESYLDWNAINERLSR